MDSEFPSVTSNTRTSLTYFRRIFPHSTDRRIHIDKFLKNIHRVRNHRNAQIQLKICVVHWNPIRSSATPIWNAIRINWSIAFSFNKKAASLEINCSRSTHKNTSLVCQSWRSQPVLRSNKLEIEPPSYQNQPVIKLNQIKVSLVKHNWYRSPRVSMAIFVHVSRSCFTDNRCALLKLTPSVPTIKIFLAGLKAHQRSVPRNRRPFSQW